MLGTLSFMQVILAHITATDIGVGTGLFLLASFVCALLFVRIQESAALKRSFLLALGILLCVPAFAHDLWLVPPPTATVGSAVEVNVSVGMDFPTSIHSLKPERMGMAAVGPKGKSAEVALRQDEEGLRALATFTPPVAGGWLVSGVTTPNQIEMKAAKFNDYLLHDGLPHVLAGRMDRGELNQDAVERYTKYVKGLVSVGSPTDESAALAVVGHVLEIVPLADPLTASVGETLAVRVLFRGKPLERANLCWDYAGNGEDFTGQTWTDAEGKALVPITKPELMTLRLVHMTRPMAEEYEWESFWASYTFRVNAK